MKSPQRLALALSAAFLTIGPPAIHATDAEGVIKVRSTHSVADTVKRFESIFKKKGITLFAKVDHQAGAKKAGMTLRPTTLLIFGNPKLGTPLMRCQPSVALDLPQKVLVAEDEKGEVWISYNAPEYLAQRHEINDCEKPLLKVGMALKGLTAKAAE